MDGTDDHSADEMDRGLDQDGGLWPEYCNPSYKMPEEINVEIHTNTGDYSFPVLIEKFSSKKTYFGGHRNRLSGKVYHHASSQTPTENKPEMRDFSNLRTRETQTFEQRTCSVQPYREAGTQMQRIDLYLDNKSDKVIVSKPYFTSQRLLALKRLKTIEIQRCWRGYMARCRAIVLQEKLRSFEGKAKEESNMLAQTMQQQKELELTRRAQPKSKVDFAILYNELDEWRQAEIAKIKATISPGSERSKAMAEVLETETKGLQNIDKLKAVAARDSKTVLQKQMMELMALPQQWQLSTGEIASVHTAATSKAKEYLQLYQQLSAPPGTLDDRLDILLQVKWSVKAFDGGPLVRDITELVDREADLLNRGRPAKSLEGLRTRLANMFLQFVQSEQYNPRAGELLGLPKPPSRGKTDRGSRRLDM